MNIGSSLESAISSLQRNVDDAKSVAGQIAKEAEQEESKPTVNGSGQTIGQIVDVEA